MPPRRNASAPSWKPADGVCAVSFGSPPLNIAFGMYAQASLPPFAASSTIACSIPSLLPTYTIGVRRAFAALNAL